MEIIIKPLSLDLLDDWLYFFEKVGFADNPEWSGCYCRYYHFAGSNKKWGKQTKEKQKCFNQFNTFWYNEWVFSIFWKSPIGWCNINLRDNFAKELYDYDSQDSKEKKIAGIVCFLMGHTYRKQGIARKLLKYAISHYTDKGYDIIESYPRVGELSDAHSYRGPVSLYESEGFKIYKELKGLYVMRKEL